MKNYRLDRLYLRAETSSLTAGIASVPCSSKTPWSPELTCREFSVLEADSPLRNCCLDVDKSISGVSLKQAVYLKVRPTWICIMIWIIVISAARLSSSIRLSRGYLSQLFISQVLGSRVTFFAWKLVSRGCIFVMTFLKTIPFSLDRSCIADMVQGVRES